MNFDKGPQYNNQSLGDPYGYQYAPMPVPPPKPPKRSMGVGKFILIGGVGMFVFMAMVGACVEEDTTPGAVAVSAMPPAPPIPVGPVDRFGDGTHAVNLDIVPGIYRTGGGRFCHWERLSSLSGEFGSAIVRKYSADGVQTVEILPSDAGFMSKGCATWSKVEVAPR